MCLVVHPASPHTFSGRLRTHSISVIREERRLVDRHIAGQERASHLPDAPLSAAAPTGRTWGDDAPTTKRFREMDTLSRAAQPARLFLCLPRAAPTTDAPRQRAPHAPPLASTGRPIHPWITALTGHREPRQGRPTPMTGRAGTRGMAWEPTQRRTALHARATRSQAQPHLTRLLLGGRR